MLPRGDTAGMRRAAGYSPEVVVANKNSPSPPKTVCARSRDISYER